MHYSAQKTKFTKRTHSEFDGVCTPMDFNILLALGVYGVIALSNAMDSAYAKARIWTLIHIKYINAIKN